MSPGSEAYSLGVFGLTATQRMVLASLCKLSRNRTISYSLADTDAARSADIIIVDADDPAAVEGWKGVAPVGRAPVVFVSAAPLTDLDANQYNLIRSHMSGGLLQVLDRVAAGELRTRAPVVVSDDAAVEREAPQPPHAQQGSTYARALIIDDSLSVRTQMRLCLEKLDIAADLAEDARQGLDKLQEGYFDLVFLDVMLPDMDGYQVCKLIKKDPDTRRVPVVMLTSKGSPINRLQGSIAGCDRYLIKPATEKDVIKVVRAFVPGVPDNFSLKPV